MSTFESEEIVLADGTRAKKTRWTYEGRTTETILVPDLKIQFLPNDDAEGGEYPMPSHWDKERQQVVPYGFGKDIDRGRDAGKPMYWQDEAGQWYGRFDAIDYKTHLASCISEARRNLGDKPRHPILKHVLAAEALLRDTTSDFFLDDERLRAKDLLERLTKYNNRMWSARMERRIRRQQGELARARNGKFIDGAEAVKFMEQADYKVEKVLDPWSGTEIPNSGGKKRGISYFHDLMISYEGKWRRLARVDLSNQCATGSYNMDGTNHSKEEWIERVSYGVVVTDDDWYVVDAMTDG